MRRLFERSAAGLFLLLLLLRPPEVLGRDGSSFVVERIEILGNARTKEDLIIRSMPLKQGDVLTSKRLTASERDLYRTRLFRTVFVSSKPGSSEGKAVVVVYLEEKRFGDINAGVEYSELDGLTFVSDIRYVNLRGEGKNIALSYDLGERRKGWWGTYGHPYLFGSRFSLLVDLYASRFERDLYPDTELAFRKAQRIGLPFDPALGNPDRNGVYRLGRMGATLGFRHSLTGGYRAAFRFSAEDIDVRWLRAPRAFGPYAQEVQDSQGRDALMTFGVEFQKTLLEPSRRIPQTEVSASFEYSPSPLGSVSHFVRLKAGGAEHLPLGPGHELSLGFKAGALLGDPPFYERLFLDGDYQLRGFERRAIGAEGGSRILAVEAVYSVPAWRVGRVFLFGEAANVWVKGRRIKLRDLNGTFGVGASLLNRIELSYGFGPRTLILRMHRVGGISAGL